MAGKLMYNPNNDTQNLIIPSVDYNKWLKRVDTRDKG